MSALCRCLAAMVIVLGSFGCADEAADTVQPQAGENNPAPNNAGENNAAENNVGENNAPAEPVDVTVRGAFEVGQRVETITYRPEGLDEDRTIRMVVWYPTDITDGEENPSFGTSFVDAPLAAQGQFPVLVYSHGTSSFAECAYGLMEHFASHGFVVASPDHTNDTIADFNVQRTTEMFVVRPQDLIAVIDWLYDRPDDDPLQGRLTDQLALSGHSFGGFTAFAAVGASYTEALIDDCENVDDAFCVTMDETFAGILREGFRDERVRVVIPMAPGNSVLFGADGVRDVEVPVMHMSATLDSSCPNETEGDPYWDQVTSAGSMRVNYDKGGHHSYILTCELSAQLGDSNGGGCGEEFTDFETLLEATNIYALAFARHHLFGDDNMLPILRGEASVFEDVTLTVE